MMKNKLERLDVKHRLERKFEKIYTSIYDDSNIASKWVASQIADLIKEKTEELEYCVLGLATGSTPIGIYKELVRLHKEEGLSFKNVVTFNLDEYYPINPDHTQSYRYFMNEHLFNHIDILPENINIPDGILPMDELYSFCSEYEEKIRNLGGIDLQILGIGRTGHIGFNEPGSGMDSPTRLVTLDDITIADAEGDFFAKENVPRRAITMGVGTIMTAKRIILMAWGEKKACVIKKAVEEQITDTIPSSYLQLHPDTEILLDPAAASELTRINTPWLVSDCKWDDSLIKKAIIWLCNKVDKPILKLTNRDYNNFGLGTLVTNHGPAYNINIRVFNELQHTITGWPGGKPNADDSNRPERAKPFPKKALVFSPHPDDDVIYMGGTLGRLVDQGNEVFVAYQTSGNIAVSDDDVIRYADFVNMFNNAFNYETDNSHKWYKEVVDFITNKIPGQIDSPNLQKAKELIRMGEAKAACRFIGIPEKNVNFLNLSFYRTGTIKKAPLLDEDVQKIVDLLRKIKPNQIFAAGDLSDPHGTHRVCFSAIKQALEIVKHDDWIKETYVWLYRGAIHEWGISEIDMAVPLSPEEVLIKRKAIFMHQTQKDRVMFPDSEEKEFWKRAEDRNQITAKIYHKLGLAEYEAMEAFIRLYF